MCRAVPRLGAHMLGYAGKTLVRRQIGEKLGQFMRIEMQPLSHHLKLPSFVFHFWLVPWYHISHVPRDVQSFYTAVFMYN